MFGGALSKDKRLGVFLFFYKNSGTIPECRSVGILLYLIESVLLFVPATWSSVSHLLSCWWEYFLVWMSLLAIGTLQRPAGLGNSAKSAGIFLFL